MSSQNPSQKDQDNIRFQQAAAATMMQQQMQDAEKQKIQGQQTSTPTFSSSLEGPSRSSQEIKRSSTASTTSRPVSSEQAPLETIQNKPISGTSIEGKAASGISNRTSRPLSTDVGKISSTQKDSPSGKVDISTGNNRSSGMLFKEGTNSDDEDSEPPPIQEMLNKSNLYKRFASLPFFLRVLLFLFIIAIVLLIPALIASILPHKSYNIFQGRNGQPLNANMETIRYSLYVTGIFINAVVSFFLVSILIFLFLKLPAFCLSKRKREKTTHRFLYLRGMKTYFAYVVFMTGLCVLTSVVLVDNSPTNLNKNATNTTVTTSAASPANPTGGSASKPQSATTTTTEVKSNSGKSEKLETNKDGLFYYKRSLEVILLFTIFLLIEKIILQSIAVEFHKTAFAERAEKLSSDFSVFHTIWRIVSKKHEGKEEPSSSIANENVDLEKNDTKLQSGTSNSRKSDSTSVDIDLPTSLESIDLTQADKEYLTIYSSQEAKKKAKIIFDFFIQGKDRDYIVADDLKLFYRKDEHLRAIEFLDSENTGKVTKEMTKRSVQKLFKERCDLHSSIHDHGKIVTKFDAILRFVVVLATIIIGLSFYEISIAAYLTSIGTFALTFTFIFGGFCKSVFEDLIFIFSVHPFDVGDNLMFENEHVTVTKIEILTTTMTRWDGQIIYVPTANLVTKNIFNLKRSGYQTETIDVNLAANTGLDRIWTLRKNVTDALAKESRNFTGKLTMSGFDVDGEKMKVKFSIEHRGNFQDLEIKNERHNKIKVTLKEQLEALDIKYFGV